MFTHNMAVAVMGDRLATIYMGQKMGGGAAVPLFRGGGVARSPSNAMSSQPRPIPRYQVPSGVLIHPAVCPQKTWAENWGLYPFWGS